MICRAVAFACLSVAVTAANALEPGSCETIRGRATYYSADGQLRIWHVGTHHEFEPDSTSWKHVVAWMYSGVAVKYKDASAPELAATTVQLYGNFRVCPTETFRKGAVQAARVQSVTHRHYVVVP